ncbi:hypothetical protein CC99x_009705 [Candidatus Berkiella cookevillensis]|nr:hypothetical protein [Candidatus Berkiella cookevillensis]MCS5709179.1 hypothetical protein [Candidatus Berkiella cookevillensis]
MSLLTLVSLYWFGLMGPYLLDDMQSIQPAQLQTFSWSILIEISSQNETGPFGRPLSILSFALNHLWFGAEPFSYKLINLLLHFLTGMTLAWFVYLLQVAYRPKLKHKAMLCFLTAFIWLIHPLQVSTVLYVVQRMTILCQLYTLLACCLYIYARLRQRSQKSYVFFFILSGFSAVLALLAKETAVLIPFYLFIIEYFIINFKQSSQESSKRFYQYAKIFILSIIFFALSAYWYNLDHYMAIFAEKPFSLWERLLTQINVLSFYIKLIYLPNLSQMSLYHDDFAIAGSINLEVILNLILLSSFLLCIYLCRKRAALIAFGFAWFFVSHLLESTLLPLELVFEHRNYLASFGLILVPVYLILHLTHVSTSKYRYIFSLLGVSLIAVLMLMTWMRSNSWSSTEKFLQNALVDKPNSARTHIEFANWLMEKGAYSIAYAELLQAQKIEPHNLGILLHMLLMHCYAEEVPEALYQQAKEKISQYPITPYAILVLDQLVNNFYQQQCKSIDKDKIHKIIQSAYKNSYLKHRPRYKAVLYNLEAGLLLLNNNKQDAKILLMRSFETYPKRMQPLITKATLELQAGEQIEAKKTIDILDKNKMLPYAPRTQLNQLKHLYELQEEE